VRLLTCTRRSPGCGSGGTAPCRPGSAQSPPPARTQGQAQPACQLYACRISSFVCLAGSASLAVWQAGSQLASTPFIRENMGGRTSHCKYCLVHCTVSGNAGGRMMGGCCPPGHAVPTFAVKPRASLSLLVSSTLPPAAAAPWQIIFLLLGHTMGISLCMCNQAHLCGWMEWGRRGTGVLPQSTGAYTVYQGLAG
jgi:hypothetical protein